MQSRGGAVSPRRPRQAAERLAASPHRWWTGGRTRALRSARGFLGADRTRDRANTRISTLQVLCDESARIVKELTGYDRVMVYRFDNAGMARSSEQRTRAGGISGQSLSRIRHPQIARRLYERIASDCCRHRIYSCSLEPRLSPISGEELDMSLCFLRSASPIHIQYFKKYGVAATLVVSLMVAAACGANILP